MKVVEDILKGILLISLIAISVLFFYQKSVLKDPGVERGEVVEEEKAGSENIEYDAVEYTSLYEERGVHISNPSLSGIEKGEVVASGSVYIEGYMEDASLLGPYPILAHVSHVDNLPGFKTYTIKNTEDGKFSDAIPFEDGKGVYRIELHVPQTQHSYDDIGVAKIITFYIENVGESVNSEGLKSYQDIDFGVQFIYPGEVYFQERIHNIDNLIKTASFYADCEVFDKCDNFDTNEIPVLNFSIYINRDGLSLEEWESKNTGNRNEYTVVEIAGHKAIKFDMSPLSMPIDTYYIEARGIVFRFSAIPGIINIEDIFNSLEFVETPEGWKRYESEEYGFEVQYPENWKYLNRNGGSLTPFAVMFLDDAGYYEYGGAAYPGHYPEKSFNVVLYSEPSNHDESINAEIENAKSFEQRKATVSGKQWMILEKVSHHVTTDKDRISIKAYTEHDGYIYILESSRWVDDDFANMKENFDFMFNSFKFIE